MKPIRLTARGYRSFADLDYTFVDGATAVVGANGAGKSSLIGAVEIALFGPRSRSMEPLVREGADELQLCLEFSHGDDVYRVRRGWKGGRSTLDLEQERVEGEWSTMTQGNAADTQTAIEALIGVNRATFTASGYLAQRASDSFTGAQPKDRKRILSAALALDQWQQDADRVGADRRNTEKTLAEVTGRIDGLAERAAQANPLAAEAADLRLLIDIQTAAEGEQRTVAVTEAVRAAALDEADTAWKIARAAVDTARARETAHLAALERSRAAEEQQTTLAEQAAELGPVPDIAALEQTERGMSEHAEAHRLATIEAQAAMLRRNDLLGRASDANEQAFELRGKADATLAAVGNTHCDTCGQTLGAEAAQVASDSYRAKADALDAEAKTLDGQATAVVIPKIPAAVEADAIEAVRERLTRARDHAAVYADLTTRIQALEATIAETDTDDFRDTARRLAFELAEAEQTLAAIAQPDPGAAAAARAQAVQAQTAADQHASRARQASERLAAVTALLEQAQAALVDHQAAVLERDRLHAELDILVRLEQAFGRDGIPAWIVESQALPHIESEANRILSRLGGAISRVELRTERETKTGEKRDALDIVCHTDDGERALETFSGGEQSRAEIALALGLVDVLQSRRDADLRYLALDEPSGLDGQGTEALAEVLRERAAGTVVLLASHDSNLRDQFDQAVLVDRGPGGSTVTA